MSPVSTRIMVDLPLPLGPTIPVIPGRSSRFTRLRPMTSP